VTKTAFLRKKRGHGSGIVVVDCLLIVPNDGIQLPIRDYLCLILPGLANFEINRIGELTPAAWLAKN
jgi:hypothetical protein